MGGRPSWLAPGAADPSVSIDSNVSKEPGSLKWLIVGVCLVGLVAWMILGGRSPAPVDGPEATPTTSPVSTPEVDNEPSIGLDAAGENIAAAGRPVKPEFVARTSAGLTPLQAVGEEIEFSVAVVDLGITLFTNPNTGSAGPLSLDSEQNAYLSSTHLVQVVRGEDGRFWATAQDLSAPDSRAIVLREVEEDVSVFPGPTSEQAWLVSEVLLERMLVELETGDVFETGPLHASSHTVTFSPTAFSPDGRWLLVNGTEGSTVIVHVETGTEFLLGVDSVDVSAGSSAFFPLDYASR